MSKLNRLPAVLFSLTLVICHVYVHAQSRSLLIADAGIDIGICLNDSSVKIGGLPAARGGTPPYTYSWQPTTGLDFTNVANPRVFPGKTINYVLTVTDSTGNTSTDGVTVSILPLPVVNAGADQSITQGTNTLLHGSGAVNYYWSPAETLNNQNTATPTAEPYTTTDYCVIGVDSHGCTNYDCTTVFVLPSEDIVLYNAFTPNGDGDNDFFYLGNIPFYPDSRIEIFNRNGKLVFQQAPYLNAWNGKVDGTDLPCATYYYVLYPGNGKPKIRGAVTIIR